MNSLKTIRLLWPLLLLAKMALLVHGQSSFYFSNITRSFDAPVFDADGNRLSGTNYLGMLYGGPTGDSLQPARAFNGISIMTPEPFTFVAFGRAGYFSGDIVNIASVSCGGAAWLQVRAWDARLGPNYEEVLKLGIGGYGASNVFFADHGGNPCGLPSPPELLYSLQSFHLLPVVPEPSPALLFLLALPWLIWRCRRLK